MYESVKFVIKMTLKVEYKMMIIYHGNFNDLRIFFMQIKLLGGTVFILSLKNIRKLGQR